MKSVRIHKIPNGVGNYTAQFYDEQKHKWVIEAWKYYEDAVAYYYEIHDLTKETHLEKSLILELQ